MQNRIAFAVITLAAGFAVSAAAQSGTANSPEQQSAEFERFCRERHSLLEVPLKLERFCLSFELNRDAETLIAQAPEQRVEIYLTLKQGVQPEAFAVLTEQYQIELAMTNFNNYRQGEYQSGGGVNLGMFRGSFQEKLKLFNENQRIVQANWPQYPVGDPRTPRHRSMDGDERLFIGGTGYTTLRQFARLRSDPQVKGVSLTAKVSDAEYQSYQERQADHAGPPYGIGTGTAFGSSSPLLRLNKKP